MASQKTILVVDDDPNQLKILSIYLEKHEYVIEVASDGNVGIERYKEMKEKIGLIITDMQMPLMTGEEFVKDINKIDPKVPIIILSGTGFNFEHLKHIPNIKEIIEKPVNLEKFHLILDQHYVNF